MIKEQFITDTYAAYNSDCMYVLPTLPDNSCDLSIYSPPFAGLYNYSSSENDFSNCETKEQFLQQYDFLINEMARITKPGRINAVHVTDINTPTGLWDFPHEVIRIHEKYGMEYKNRITVWKEPLKVRMRTMVKSLTHQSIVEDATSAFPAMPDYILIFRKKGECEVPVTHPFGMQEYFGETPMLPGMEEKYGPFEELKKKYAGWQDHRTNKLAHVIWQRYASSVWDDIRIDNVLPFQDARDEDDEKHVHPLQLDVIDRLVELYSNPGDLVVTPFAGVGSEMYSPVSMGRKALGIELKESYFKQLLLNMAQAETRFSKPKQMEIFDSINE